MSLKTKNEVGRREKRGVGMRCKPKVKVSSFSLLAFHRTLGHLGMTRWGKGSW